MLIYNIRYKIIEVSLRISYICKFSNISELSKWFGIGFDKRNQTQNISGTTYLSDLCLYAKRT